MNAMNKFLTAHNYRNAYILVAMIVASSYYFMRELFIKQSTWGFMKSSPLTLNIIILFGLWGMFHGSIIKVKNPFMNILVLVVGFMVIVLFFRFIGGMPTIFG